MKVAVNPLPWVLSDAGFQLSRTVLLEALADLRGVGFRALHAQVPDDMTVDEYRQTLSDYGFVPAPGYFSADFADVASGQEVREQARHAAEEHIQLGLSEMFIASAMSTERMAHPAVGYLPDDERLRRFTDGMVAAAEVMQAEGVTAALHSHVGSWEARFTPGRHCKALRGTVGLDDDSDDGSSGTIAFARYTPMSARCQFAMTS